MSINKARRGFLKLLPAAPFGVAVAAKEAAASMGLSGPIGANIGGSMAYAGASMYGNPVSDGGNWIVDAWKDFNSKQRVESDWMQAKQMARVLDADIAAMRSISPARAYQMQVERCFKIMRDRDAGYLKRLFDEWSKQNPSAAMAAQILI